MAESLDNLAQVYAAQGNHTSAQDLYQRALEVYHLSVGEQHPGAAITLNNLAKLNQQMGNLTDAESLYRQALEVYRATLGEEHPFFLAARENLVALHHVLARRISIEKVEQEILPLHQEASRLREQGRFKEAIPLAEKQLEILRKAGVDEQNPQYATSLSNLGDLYRLAGNYGKAEPLLKRALKIYGLAVGKEHLYFAGTLDSLAALYHQKGDYARAEPLYRQALETKQRILGNEHPDVAVTLSNFAMLHAERGDYEAAASLMSQSLELACRTLGEEHPFVVATRDALANLYLVSGFSPSAQTEAEGIEAQLGQLSVQADQLRDEGRFAEAIPLLEQQQCMVRQLEDGEENLSFARVLSKLGWLHYELGDYAEAEPLLRRAEEITRRMVGEADPEYARELNNLALLLRAIGDYPAALEMSERALKIARTTLGEEDPHVATMLNNLAGLHMAMGNYSAAEPLYQKALTIRRRSFGETNPQVAEILDNLGSLYYAIGDYGTAKEHAQQALYIYRLTLGDRHPDVATTLGNLAGMYITMRDYDTGLTLLEQALVTERAVFGEQHPAVAFTLDRFAGLRRAQGKYSVAEDLYLKALAMDRALLGEHHPRVAEGLFNLAELYREMGDFSAAERQMREAVQISENQASQNHPVCAWMVYILALLCAAGDRNDEALSYLMQAAALEDRAIGQVFSIGSDRQRLNYLALAHTTYDFYLSVFVKNFRSIPEATQAALGFVLRRKALALESLMIQRDAVLRGRYPALAYKLRELATLRLQIAQKTLSGSGIYDPIAHERVLAEWHIRQERLETELARQIPEMNLKQQFRTADRQVVTGSLPEGSSLVEFVRFNVYDFKAVPAIGGLQWKPARYLAFVLPAGEPDNVNLIDLGEAAGIEQMVAGFRASITGGDRALTKEPEPVVQAAGTASGAALRAAVFDPLLDALDGCKRLFLAPDGDLSQLPFEALPMEDGQFVIDVYTISYLSTGRDVVRFATTTSVSRQPPVVLADPDYNLDAEGIEILADEQRPISRQSRDLNRSTLRFTRLKGAQEEGEQVGDLLGVKPLIAQAALEGTLKDYRSPRILHLATHGFFLPDQPRDPNPGLPDLPTMSSGGEMSGQLFGRRLENPMLRSGLALSGANTWLQGKTLRPEAEDGLLTAEDVTGLDLLDTELVVLSACDTGRGEVHVGEGVFGLRRAFVLAGAKTLVMSLWKVPDQATRELMVDFYERLLTGTSRAEALRAAQRALKARPGYEHPRFWGAFICQGDPGR